MRILLVSATPFELAPTVNWLRASATSTAQNVLKFERCEVEVLFPGVGMMATAFALGNRFAGGKVDLAIQAGIGGAIDRNIPLGAVVSVTSEILGDLGAEDANGDLLTVADLGFPPGPPFDKDGKLVMKQVAALPFPEVQSVTVNRATGSAESVRRLQEKFPAAQVESMEGAAFFYACLYAGVQGLQLRGISNYVEARNREGWEVGKAIEAVNVGLRRVLKGFA